MATGASVVDSAICRSGRAQPVGRTTQGAMAAQGLANSPNITASVANIAFAKANLAQLKPKMDAAEWHRRPEVVQ